MIGAGGTAAVYEAVHEFTRKQVAFKILSLDSKTKDNLITKMRSEAMLLCQVRHKNLVEVFDAGIDESHGIWMAMELLEGKMLREVMTESGAMPSGRALNYAIQIADGMAVAHDMSVIHRDLKPENVFVTSRGELKVLDFGIAKFQDMQSQLSAKSQVMGTVPYMSPEHLSAETLDGRTDIYALGLMLYEMLAGQHPFINEQGKYPPMGELVMIQLTMDAPSIADVIGDKLWWLVSACMTKNRDERYQTMSQLAQAMRELLQELTAPLPVAARELGPNGTDPTLGAAPMVLDETQHASAEQLAMAAAATAPPVPPEPAPPQPAVAGLGSKTLLILMAVTAALGVILALLLTRDDSEVSAETAAQTTTPSASIAISASQTENPVEQAPPTASTTAEAAPPVSASTNVRRVVTPPPPPSTPPSRPQPSGKPKKIKAPFE